MLTHLQQITIQAFITALAELDSPLPADLQKQINQIGDIISTQSTDALNKLIELAQNPHLNKLYLQARVNIQQEYETQERNKYRNYQKESESRDTPIYITENISKALPLDSIEEIQPILQASDSVKEAQKYQRETNQKIRRGLL